MKFLLGTTITASIIAGQLLSGASVINPNTITYTNKEATSEVTSYNDFIYQDAEIPDGLESGFKGIDTRGVEELGNGNIFVANSASENSGWAVFNKELEMVEEGDFEFTKDGVDYEFRPYATDQFSNGNIILSGSASNLSTGTDYLSIMTVSQSSGEIIESFVSAHGGAYKDVIVLDNDVAIAMGSSAYYVTSDKNGNVLVDSKFRSNYGVNYVDQLPPIAGDERGRVVANSGETEYIYTFRVDDNGVLYEYDAVHDWSSDYSLYKTNWFPFETGHHNEDRHSDILTLSNGNVMMFTNSGELTTLSSDNEEFMVRPDADEAYTINWQYVNDARIDGTEYGQPQSNKGIIYESFQFDNGNVMVITPGYNMYLLDEDGNFINHLKVPYIEENSRKAPTYAELLNDGRVFISARETVHIATPVYNYASADYDINATKSNLIELMSSEELGLVYGEITYNDLEALLRQTLVTENPSKTFDDPEIPGYEDQFAIPYLNDPTRVGITFYEDDLVTPIEDKSQIWDVDHMNFKLTDLYHEDDEKSGDDYKNVVIGESEIMTVSLAVPLSFRYIENVDSSQTRSLIRYQISIPTNYEITDIEILTKEDGEYIPLETSVYYEDAMYDGYLTISGLNADTTYNDLYVSVTYNIPGDETPHNNMAGIEEAAIPTIYTLDDEIDIYQDTMIVNEDPVTGEWLSIDGNNFSFTGNISIYDDSTKGKFDPSKARAEMTQIAPGPVAYTNELDISFAEVESPTKTMLTPPSIRTHYEVTISGEFAAENIEEFNALKISLTGDEDDYIMMVVLDESGQFVINPIQPEDTKSSHWVMYTIIGIILTVGLAFIVVMAILVIRREMHHH